MAKMFAIEGDKIFVRQGKAMYECVLIDGGVKVLGKAKVESTDRYDFDEIRAKCAGFAKAAELAKPDAGASLGEPPVVAADDAAGEPPEAGE